MFLYGKHLVKLTSIIDWLFAPQFINFSSILSVNVVAWELLMFAKA
jgi:hypothetical protein